MHVLCARAHFVGRCWSAFAQWHRETGLLGDKVDARLDSVGLDDGCQRWPDDGDALEEAEEGGDEVAKEVEDPKQFDLPALRMSAHVALRRAKRVAAGGSQEFTKTPRRAEPRRTRKTPKRKMPDPRARSRCARKA